MKSPLSIHDSRYINTLSVQLIVLPRDEKSQTRRRGALIWPILGFWATASWPGNTRGGWNYFPRFHPVSWASLRVYRQPHKAEQKLGMARVEVLGHYCHTRALSHIYRLTLEQRQPRKHMHALKFEHCLDLEKTWPRTDQKTRRQRRPRSRLLWLARLLQVSGLMLPHLCAH